MTRPASYHMRDQVRNRVRTVMQADPRSVPGNASAQFLPIVVIVSALTLASAMLSSLPS